MVAWVINDESIYGILLLLLLFDGTGVWTQGLALARQVLCHLSHALDLGIIVDGICNIGQYFQVFATIMLQPTLKSNGFSTTIIYFFLRGS
jgi:hypothetical protein